jgi:hypothetical protein
MVESLIGNFGEPLSRLAVHIVQVGEVAQWPEILAHVPNTAAFYFSFGLSRQLHPVVTVRGNISG